MNAIRATVLILLLFMLAGCSTIDKTEQYSLHEVLYLSVRKANNSNRPGSQFNGQRGDTAYGGAIVAIDRAGAHTSHAREMENRILTMEDPVRSGPIQSVRGWDKSEFLNSIGHYLETPGSTKEVMIYIHGYRKDFSRSLFNAAQLRHQLAFPGPVIAFSWPSNHSWTGYVSDIDNVEWAEPRLCQLIHSIRERFPEARIHVLAHSLGNRAMIGTLLSFLGSDTPWPFGEIVFLAPDIDRDTFIHETGPALAKSPSRLTLYVSSRDFPLMASAQVFHYPRLGDSRTGAPVIKGFQTIDVSDAISITSGHGYYEESREAIEDLFYLVREGKGAGERPNLIPVETETGTYWRLQPED
ncbi:MAG: alpha/beta hydrolase [Opitutales bacterium]|jgi:esterase/lipase superfamily enzyme